MNGYFTRGCSPELAVYALSVLFVVVLLISIFFVLLKHYERKKEDKKLQELKELKQSLEQMSDVELKLFYGVFCRNKEKLIGFSMEKQSLLESEMLRRNFTLTSKYKIKT